MVLLYIAAIHEAAEKGDLDTIKTILSEDQSQLESHETGYNQRTPLMVALLNDQYDAAKLLLESKANVNAYDVDKESVVHFATNKEDDSRYLALVLSYKPDLSITESCFGRTALHYALMNDNVELVSLLLDANTPILPDLNGNTPQDLVNNEPDDYQPTLVEKLKVYKSA